jgi:hypothetical protein
LKEARTVASGPFNRSGRRAGTMSPSPPTIDLPNYPNPPKTGYLLI